MWFWLAVSVGMLGAIYVGFVLLLLALGRTTDARAWAGFVPDCVILCTRLGRDPRLSRLHKWLLVGLIAYLSLPFDLIPDFIPIAGALDDAILVAITLRLVFRKAGPELVQEHWPGPQQSLAVMLRLAGDRTAT
jgi:uncharacterized membrane protein YkvA (DUF1232 family)